MGNLKQIHKIMVPHILPVNLKVSPFLGVNGIRIPDEDVGVSFIGLDSSTHE